ncbi:hypothetical protein CYCD_02590 [Tenuifilaceae bacterium CYCD]|nr:hypothetical protein CYCD_02590 [Tenuifilaceae bacterium CYCD]
MMNSGDYSGFYNYQMDTLKKPFFGRTQQILDKIHSLDEKWYVEFWMIRYYFMGIEVYSFKKEVVKYLNGKSNSSKKPN